MTTNAEKYKTADGRIAAFRNWCKISEEHGCGNCQFSKSMGIQDCGFRWLELEALDDVLPCPFCGEKALRISADGIWQIRCRECGYASKRCSSEKDAVQLHNGMVAAIISSRTADKYVPTRCPDCNSADASQTNGEAER